MNSNPTPSHPGFLAPGQSLEDQLGHSVVNLSDLHLTKCQVEVLQKGLTFCPTPAAPDIVRIWDDLTEFTRRLKLKRHFHDIHTTTKDGVRNPFKNKSTWTPPEGNDPILEAFIKTVKIETLLADYTKVGHSNLTKKQFQAIKQLSDNPDIVIKKADKGSAVCVINTTDYLREGLRQLGNCDTYQLLTSDPTTKFSATIETYLTDMLLEETIDLDTFEYLNISNPKPGRFYLLPKIHKLGIPGRPICGSNNHPTERISEFVDHHIKKYVPLLPSYIRDTQHFIKRVKQAGPLPEGALLVTWDVCSLYTNIPNFEGINSVVEQVRNDPDAEIPANQIGKLLEMILHMNHFEFNKKLYLQLIGTAMGTKCAPNFAGLFLGKFEKKLQS